MRIHGTCTSHPGTVRFQNQDRFVVRDDLSLYAVLDGMGGAPAGDVAAERARDGLVAGVTSATGDTTSRVRQGIAAASDEVARETQRDPRNRGMGSTLVALLADQAGRAVVGHVGDSRAYLLRAGVLHRLTHDHCLAQEMIDAGGRVPRGHRAWSVLTRSLASPAAPPEVSRLQLAPRDRLLLCSDGLHGYAEESKITSALERQVDPRLATQALVDLALTGGGGDNVTVLVVDVEP